MAERRAFGIGPEPAPVRHDDDQPPVILQKPPDIAQQAPGIVGLLETMHQQDPVEHQIGERQRIFFRQAGQAGTAERPGGQAHLLRRHGNAPRRLFAPKL